MDVLPLEERNVIVCHSDWDEIIGHMVHYLRVIDALIYLAKVPGRILFCKDLLSSSSATPTIYIGRLELRASFDISNSTCDLGIIHDPIMWI